MKRGELINKGEEVQGENGLKLELYS